MFVSAATEEEGMMRRRHILPGERGEMPFDRHFARVHRQAPDRAIKPRFFGDVDEQVID